MAAAPPPDGAMEVPDETKIIPGADQPIEVRLKPESEFHNKILQKLRNRLQLSYRNRSSRYDDWDRVDEHRRMYVNADRAARKGNKQVIPNLKEVAVERAIVIPVSYAIHEARKAQQFKGMMARSPFIQLDGVAYEDVRPAKLMETKLAYDFRQSKGALAIYHAMDPG
jgi:hypothetical protein